MVSYVFGYVNIFLDKNGIIYAIFIFIKEVKMKFKEILEILISEYADGSQTKLSKESGIPIPTINGWLTKGRLPRYEQIVQLSNYFHVSADFLLGLTEEPAKPDGSDRFHLDFLAGDYKLYKDISSLSPSQKDLIKKTVDVLKERTK